MGNCAATWFDEHGEEWPTPTILGRLKFKIPLHARLRAFVLRRDNFTCQYCGVAANEEIPEDYTGRWAIGHVNHCLVADHIVSRRNGGDHHPDNMQALCDSCNAAKAGLVDAKGRVE